MSSTKNGMTYEEFQELLKIRTAEFINYEITEKEFRKFLQRNGFNAYGVTSEVKEALEIRRAATLAEIREAG
jgi:hypothetical protein